jgi:diacylglycerol kinase family enzyme
MKIPRDFQKSVELIKNSKNRMIDVGKITFGQGTPDQSSNYFINISDFGLGAEVIKHLSVIPSVNRGSLVYYKGLLQTLKSFQSKAVKITLDGDRVIEGTFVIGAVANGRIFGGGMIVAPEAEPDDGFFDVVLVRHMKRLEIVYNSPRLYTGSILKLKKVEIHRARKVEVVSEAPVHIEYDGELGKTLPASFEVVERVLKFRI